MIALAAILVLALGLRVFAWQRAAMMMNDGPNFLWQAERFLEGDWQAAVSHPYHPLYGLCTAGASLITGDVVTGALTVSIASGLLLCVASFFIARRLFPDVPGAPAGAALLAAVLTRSLDVTADVQADGLFAALFLCSLWALLAAAQDGGRPVRFALVGLAIGLAYLTRTEGLFALLAPGLWIVASGSAREGLRRGLACLPLAAVLLLVLAPFVIALHSVSDQWVLSLKPTLANLGLGLTGEMWRAPPDAPVGWPILPTGTDEQAHAAQRAKAEAAAREADESQAAPAPVEVRKGSFGPSFDPRPPRDAAVVANLSIPRPSAIAALNATLRRFVNAIRLETLLFVLPGLALLWRRDRRLALGVLAMVAAWLLIACVQVQRSHFLTNRHMLIPIVLLLPAGGAGVASLWKPGAGSKRVGWRTAVVAALLVAAAAGTRAQRQHHLPRLEALAWVEQNTQPDQYFVTHRLRDGWYAKRRAVLAKFPIRDISLRKRLQLFDVSVFVLDLDEVMRHSPQWFEEGLVHEVARFGEGSETVVVLESRFPE